MNSEIALTFFQRIFRRLKIRQRQAAAASFITRCFQDYWSPGGRRVLFIEDAVPHSYLGAGFPRSNRILSEMVRMELLVTLYPASDSFESWTTLYRDISLKVEVILGRGLLKLEQFLRERPGYYDLLFVSRPHNMAAIKSLLSMNPSPLNGIKIIYDAEAIFSLREIARSRQQEQVLPADKSKSMISEEVMLATGSQSVVSVSERESQVFVEHGFKQVFTLGHALEPVPGASSFDLRKDILFVGAILADSPNLDSVTWFSREILPIIRKKLSGDEPKLIIAGLDSANLIAHLNSESVKVQGKVDDLDPLYDRVRIFVAPTRFAAGIPLKVYEAAAHGVPVVTTSLIASQLGWLHGVELLVADNPNDFAEACLSLYLDRELWNRLRSNALERVKSDCSPEIFSAQLKRIIWETLGTGV